MPEPLEELYDEDAYTEDTYPVRAVQTMPFRGQVMAWFMWRMPYTAYLLTIAGGIALCFFDQLGPGVGTTIAGVLLLILSWYCRTNHRSPWEFALIQTREPVPSDLRAAAAQGLPVPDEDMNREKETQT